MSLSDIKNKLYQKKSDKDLSKHGSSSFDIRTGGVEFSDKFKTQEAWKESGSVLNEEQNQIIKRGAFVLAGILAVVLLAFGIAKFVLTSFDESRVVVAIDGPKEGKSGETLSFVVTYKNDNRAVLKNAVLRVGFPENFKAEENPNFKPEGDTGGTLEIGEIKSGATGQFVLKGRAYNPKGTVIYIKTDLLYVPSNFNSQFSAKNQIGINVTLSPIELEVMAPQNISSGNAIDYLVSYKNIGQKDISDVGIRMDYPEGFAFGKSSVTVSEGNNVWYIGRLAAGESGKIIVSGKLEGKRDEVKNVKVYIGAIEQGNFVYYNEEKLATVIVSSPLAILQKVNGLSELNVKAGDMLKFEIGYRNEGDLGLSDVIITEKIESPVLDYTTLKMEKGSFDSENNIITWKASDIPDLKLLEPGQEGTVNFEIKVKSVIPVVSENDKNFIISCLAKIDSPDIFTPIASNKTIAGNKLNIKLNSKIVLDVKGFYNDPVTGSSGIIPPQVGKETNYMIYWFVSSVSNDVSDARVETILPAGVTLTEKKYPEDARLNYNKRTNEVSWEIGNLSAGTGTLSSPKGVSFQIKFIPSPNQGGMVSADIVGESTFSAKDTFTGENLSTIFEKKTTVLREDGALDSGGYKIMPAL
jgi:hypothetical protein